jgi:hypothetical protein
MLGLILTTLIGYGGLVVFGAFSSCGIEAVEAKPFVLLCPYPLDLFSEFRNAAEAMIAGACILIRPYVYRRPNTCDFQ